MAGRLYVVATPIGNLGDFSARARDTLAAVDLIAAEDTRHSRRLLDHFGIDTPMISLHEHNEAQRAEALLGALGKGQNVALISDAGTPLISDPGARLVSQAAQAGIEISPIPGPAALIAALSAAGLGDGRFWFEGFLPAKDSARRARLAELAKLDAPLIFYVAPHRLADILRAVHEVLGSGRQAVLARELTKIHEQIYRGTIAELVARAADDAMLSRGEIVLLVAGAGRPAATDEDLQSMARVLLEHLSVRDAARVMAKLTGSSRNRAYAVAQEVAGEGPG